MSMTLTEKIIALHSGRARVVPGDILLCRVDMTLANDITAPLAIDAFRKHGGTRVFDRERISLVPSHFMPGKDIRSAAQGDRMRKFAREQEIRHYFEVGRAGIEHVLLPERGVVASGDVFVGADSHSCTNGALGAFAIGVGSTDVAAVWMTGDVWLRVPATLRVTLTGALQVFTGGKDVILELIRRIGDDGANYRSIEFDGPGVAALAMDDRFTIANMCAEAGAKNGIFPADEKTETYERGRALRPPVFLRPDPGARYDEELTIDLDRLEPMVACPERPSNTVPVSQVAGQAVDQVVIGSCTNGRLSDLALAARFFEGRSVAPNLRCIVLPGSQDVYLEAVRTGLIETFTRAGALVSPSTCGPCLGGYMGVLGPGERCLSTTSRNFKGRMGDPTAQVWLANPAVAAATAVTGTLADPRNFDV